MYQATTYNPLSKGRDGVYRQAAARLLVAANDNTLTAPLCRQTYDLERALDAWSDGNQQRQQKEAA